MNVCAYMCMCQWRRNQGYAGASPPFVLGSKKLCLTECLQLECTQLHITRPSRILDSPVFEHSPVLMVDFIEFPISLCGACPHTLLTTAGFSHRCYTPTNLLACPATLLETIFPCHCMWLCACVSSCVSAYIPIHHT